LFRLTAEQLIDNGSFHDDFIRARGETFERGGITAGDFIIGHERHAGHGLVEHAR
jgi:hypothetical protein